MVNGFNYPLSERWRHIKRGTIYRMLGAVTLQASDLGKLCDGVSLVLYVDDIGVMHVRAQAEFFDGRFEKLGKPSTATMQAAKRDSKPMAMHEQLARAARDGANAARQGLPLGHCAYRRRDFRSAWMQGYNDVKGGKLNAGIAPR